MRKEKRKKEKGNYIRKWFGQYMFYFSTKEEYRIYKAFQKAVPKSTSVKALLLKFMHDVAVKFGTLKEPEQVELFEPLRKTSFAPNSLILPSLTKKKAG